VIEKCPIRLLADKVVDFANNLPATAKAHLWSDQNMYYSFKAMDLLLLHFKATKMKRSAAKLTTTAASTIRKIV
jgi:hypothetical protein